MAGSLRAAGYLFVATVWIIPTASQATFPQGGVMLETPYRGPGVVNHPVGVRPSSAVKVPPGWPLSADGTITCATCHQDSRAGATGMLRGDGNNRDHPKAFCIQCHDDAGSGVSVHWQAVDAAHFFLEDHRSGGFPVSQDSVSRECLSCHDGVAARDPGHTMSGRVGGFGDASRNHPVGVPYPMMGKTRADVPLRAASSVPQSVNLAGGLVSCLSCHNLYASDPARLSVPIEGSRLCLSCHDMD